jgi:hypothetical protein
VSRMRNPPVGLILTLQKDEAPARYAFDGLRNSVLAREYRLVLPEEQRLVEELETRRYDRSVHPPALIHPRHT